MAVNNEFPVFDGVSPDWASFKCTCDVPGLALLEMPDIKSLDTGTSLDVGEQRGATGGRVKKRTSGSAKSTAKATLYLDGWQKFIRNLTIAAKTLGAMRGNQALLRYVHFNIQIKQTPFGSDEIFETRLKGCFYSGRDKNHAEGTDADTVDVSLNPLEIADVVDGVEVVLL